MKLIYLITLFLFSTVAFQNCAGGGGTSAVATDSPVGIVSHQNKVVGLYDLPSVKQIHYYTAVPSPDLSISINVASPEASVSIYDSSGNVKCVLHPDISGLYARLLSELAETSLSAGQSSNAASCQAQYLELTLSDGSTHTYPFMDGCQPDGDASIVSLESSLQAVLLGIVASSGESCPAN